jgi:hypothetical protein
MRLIQLIQEFIGSGSLITKTRKDRGLNENPTVVLEITKINVLKTFTNIYLNKSSGEFSFYTKKYLDFKD